MSAFLYPEVDDKENPFRLLTKTSGESRPPLCSIGGKTNEPFLHSTPQKKLKPGCSGTRYDKHPIKGGGEAERSTLISVPEHFRSFTLNEDCSNAEMTNHESMEHTVNKLQCSNESVDVRGRLTKKPYSPPQSSGLHNAVCPSEDEGAVGVYSTISLERSKNSSLSVLNNSSDKKGESKSKDGRMTELEATAREVIKEFLRKKKRRVLRKSSLLLMLIFGL